MSQKAWQHPQHAYPERISRLYNCLSATRRCCVIQILAASESDDEPMSVRSLARQITAAEQDIRIEAATGDPYRSVYMTLVDTHLPTLDRANIIEYDSDRQTVATGQDLDDAVQLLRVFDDNK
ncbi:DUF7344 domain-containing protein [Halorubrum vacuolatum]|uniref:DUF7344 domain-containing protein n=1 Tax=Halorubrum vacuolatum TaxID=63740 RepID=UPI00117A928B|nr:hypothetical protein [Halorubrum vacuolatum]